MPMNIDADLPYSDIDETLGERLWPNEPALAGEIARAIEGFLRTKYQPGHARRDAHPKAHGIVKAEFRVSADIPDELAKGVFAARKSYEAWIRFSNGLLDDDRDGDGRGMAIKLLNVPGQKLVESEPNATTQDFILFSSPVFFIDKPQNYLALVTETGSANFWSKVSEAFTLGVKGSLIAAKLNSNIISNPLQTTYWSAVPYQLGIGSERQAVKYKVTPTSDVIDPLPADRGPDYLRAALGATLANGGATMTFRLQPRTLDTQSVEDSMNEWKEQDAPFYEVATIHIPSQTFDTPEQNQFAEDIAFSPWHALPEHRPLGVTNRLRKIIYEHVSRVRHEMNAVEYTEP
jgi:hypothetical protein